MKIKSKSMRKKSVAILAGVAIAGAVGASAASLGGLTGGEGLGADAAAVSSCDTNGIVVNYTTSYSTANDEYMLDSIDFSGVDSDCAGQDYEVTVELLTEVDFADPAAARTPEQRTYGGGTPSATVTLGGTGGDEFSVPTPNLKAESVVGLAVIISGSAISTDT